MTIQDFILGVAATVVSGLLLGLISWLAKSFWDRVKVRPHRPLLTDVVTFLMGPVKDAFEKGGTNLDHLCLLLQPDPQKDQTGPLAARLEEGPNHDTVKAARREYSSVKGELHTHSVRVSAEGPTLAIVAAELSLLDKTLEDLLNDFDQSSFYDGSWIYKKLKGRLEDHRTRLEVLRRATAGEMGYMLHGTDRGLGSRLRNWGYYRLQAWRKMREYVHELETRERREAGYRQLEK